MVETMLWAKRSKPILESERFEEFIGVRGGERELVSHKGIYVVDRTHWKAYCQERFGSPKGVFWTKQNSSKTFDVDLIDECIIDARDPEIQRSCIQEYNLYWDAAEKNQIVLKDPKLPWDVPVTKVDEVVRSTRRMEWTDTLVEDISLCGKLYPEGSRRVKA